MIPVDGNAAHGHIVYRRITGEYIGYSHGVKICGGGVLQRTDVSGESC